MNFRPVSVVTIACLFTPLISHAEVTFTSDVAPIMAEKCMRCHRPGEAAPMSLLTYDEARPWAKSIGKMVATREMPPWFADPAHGTFSNDNSLTQAQIDTILAWVDQGAKRGNPKDMPEIPEFPVGWQLGEPDFVVDLPEVTVPAKGNDYFPDLTFKADFPEKRWVRAVEIRPTRLDVAHHVVIFMNSGGTGMGGDFDVLGVWAAGTEPNVFPEGMGRILKPGQRLIANMHYHPNGVEPVKDTTRIGLHFGEGDLKHEINATIAGQFAFNIPAGDPNHRETASWYVDQDIRIVSYFPHMHLRGKDMKFTAVYPDGEEKILLSVPKYDFDWQLFYYPVEPLALPAGSRIDIEAHYDNSADNPDNPDPTRDVGFGLQSTEEMLFGVFEFVAEENLKQTAAPTPESRFRQLVAQLPAKDTYTLELEVGGQKLPSALYLPREGDGKWHAMFGRTQLALPMENLRWEGDTFAFDMTLRFGEMGGDFSVTGTVDEKGTLRGSFDDQTSALLSMDEFTGQRAQHMGL